MFIFAERGWARTPPIVHSGQRSSDA